MKTCVEEFTGNHFDEKVGKNIVVVDFFAEWCMPCLMMSPIVEEMCEKFSKIKFIKVNIDENSKLAEKFNGFFRDCRVEGTAEEGSRLVLCELTARILKQGLEILGLETVERM